jgi:ribosomal protein S18 acetylase RimI-like enzyme
MRLEDIVMDSRTDRVNWEQVKFDLLADHFDNGRSAVALQRSFEASQHVMFAWLDGRVVGMARMLSDGVCNAYLLDVWTRSSLRRRGIGRAMIDELTKAVPGQHVGLQTDDAAEFYISLGFRAQPQFMSRVQDQWLANDANR